MALTADQTALLQTAIENLNKSVEVNQEVLEICKSVGNTGAVDIATHNNDKTAHPLFNFVKALEYVTVGASGTTPHTSGSGQYLHIVSGETDSYGRIDNYGLIKAGVQNYNVAASFRGYVRTDDYSKSFNDTVLTGLGASIVYKEGEEVKMDSMGGFVVRVDVAGNTQYRVSVVKADKTFTYYMMSNSGFTCTSVVDLGSSTYQFKDCYLQNSPIVSSDERLKQDIEEVPEEVFKAWARVNFKQYRFKEAVASKGDDARKHVGLIAQHILAAFEAEGLDAADYGIVCHDSWEDQYENEQVIDAEAVFDENGNVVTPEKSHTEKRFVKAAGDVWTVRYEEALALETAYQRWRLGKIEAALADKGITL